MYKPIIIFLGCLLLHACGSKQERIDLSGPWQFELDRTDAGLAENWAQRTLTGTINLPGSLQGQGFGDDISTTTPWVGQIVDSSWYYAPEYAPYRQPGNIKLPFMLTPEKHYLGAAWYQKQIDIPARWAGRPLILHLERPHWQTQLFVDGEPCVESGQNSLAIPHRYTIGPLAEGPHTLTLRLDNRMMVEVGINAHTITDHTQTCWNGVVGALTLEAKEPIYQSSVELFPDPETGRVEVVMTIENTTGNACTIPITLAAALQPNNPVAARLHEEVHLTPGTNSLRLGLDIPHVQLWSEFAPNLYRLTSTVGNDTVQSSFGLRTLGTKNRQFTVNGTPTFLRGTLDCAIFPLTGYPPTDEKAWERIFKTIQSYGLNHIRFHSWCPPEAAFDVADRLGLYLQIECSAWALTGEGTNYDSWVFGEGDRIIAEYGNHPSFFALLAGNEPGGPNSAPLLDSLVRYWQAKGDHRRLYSSASGWPYVESADFFSTPEPRIQAWGEGLKSIINAQAPRTDFDFRHIADRITMPTVSHEIGQWCVFPNLAETAKYTGPLKARSFEIFADFLQAKGMSDLADDFLMASGKLQTLCYKADIEAALRTPGFGGFQLLGLQDFPGHGEAVLGVLDPFWDPKDYVTAEEFSRFCNRTVPLARMEKLTWRSDETFLAQIEAAHFEAAPLSQAEVVWQIVDDAGTVLKTATLTADLPLGNAIPLGTATMELSTIKKPTQLTFRVTIPALGAQNEWHIWVYPPQPLTMPKNVYVCSAPDAKLYETLRAGGRAVLMLPRGSIRPEMGGDIAVGFSPIFWNSAYTSGQPPHLLGILCDAQHPAFGSFPTASHSDYQWWEVLSQCDAMLLDGFPADFRPTIHLIDDWYKNRKLGILFEAHVLGGRLIVTSADLHTDIEKRPVAKQLRQSVLNYAASDAFNPTHTVEMTCIENLLNNKP